MTREEARETIDDILACFGDKTPGGYELSQLDAKDMRKAIETLSAEPCEDAISRAAVDTLVDELARAISDERCCIPQRGRDTGTIMSDILHLPSVQPKQESGYWIRLRGDGDSCTHLVCSKCYACWIDCGTSRKQKFCYNCGARMEGGANDQKRKYQETYCH